MKLCINFSGASNLLNKSRLEILKSQQQHIETVLTEAQQKLIVMAKDPAAYRAILVKLICQGLCQLMEKSVTIRCRQADVALVQECVPLATKQYQQVSSKDVSVAVDTTNFLPPHL